MSVSMLCTFPFEFASICLVNTPGKPRAAGALLMTACFRKKGMNCADIQGEIRVVGMSTVTIIFSDSRYQFAQKSIFVVTF